VRKGKDAAGIDEFAGRPVKTAIDSTIGLGKEEEFGKKRNQTRRAGIKMRKKKENGGVRGGVMFPVKVKLIFSGQGSGVGHGEGKLRKGRGVGKSPGGLWRKEYRREEAIREKAPF